jgi:catechol 2,3-dioxygenase-like lactoylglutathione lyase family enzyme
MAISGFYHVNVNCRDIEKSLAFYLALGFKSEGEYRNMSHWSVTAGFGVSDPRVNGAMLRLGEDPNAGRIELLEWISPRSESPPSLKLTDPGIPRIALWSTDIEGDVARLRSLGVKFLSDPIHTETGLAFVCFYDPDGNVIELLSMRSPSIKDALSQEGT